MAKVGATTLTMIVQGQSLVPASGYEAEVLASYQQGARVEVAMNQPKDNYDLKKLHAVLKRVIDDCDVPWRNVEQAKTYLKVRLGYCDFCQVDGQAVLTPQSISKFSQADLLDFMQGSWDLITEMTGVDPLTLGQESAEPDSTLPTVQEEEAARDAAVLIVKILLGAASVGGSVEEFEEVVKTQGADYRALPERLQQKVKTCKAAMMETLGQKPARKWGDMITYVAGVMGEDPKAIDPRAKKEDASAN